MGLGKGRGGSGVCIWWGLGVRQHEVLSLSHVGGKKSAEAWSHRHGCCPVLDACALRVESAPSCRVWQQSAAAAPTHQCAFSSSLSPLPCPLLPLAPRPPGPISSSGGCVAPVACGGVLFESARTERHPHALHELASPVFARAQQQQPTAKTVHLSRRCPGRCMRAAAPHLG